jgi:hypothetical protein
MRIVIELDEKIEGFKGADRFTREGLVNKTIYDVLDKAGEVFETICLLVENSECNELVMDFETSDIITRLQ